ncbi:MAG: glycosyltransferase family 2 protein [Nitrososphaerota archaeon]
MSPQVSVIVPVYNGEKYVAAAIDSVRAQTCDEWELVVVDDGSTDGTAAVLARHARDPRIRVCHQENQGLAASRNRGLALSKGEHVAFLDADDLWVCSYLTRMVRALTANPSAVAAFAGWQYVDENGAPLPQTIIPSDTQARRLRNELLWRNALVPSGVVMRRAAITACQGFDTQFLWSEDWDLWLRLLALGPFVAVPERLVWYRTHDKNMSDDIASMEAGALQVLHRHVPAEGDPAGWSEVQRRAYGYRFFIFALAYFRRGEVVAGIGKTQEALAVWPALAAQDETYYELGCAYQPRGVRGSSIGLRLHDSERLIRSLIFDHWPAPSEGTRRARWGQACVVLSALAYQTNDRSAAQRLAIQAWRSTAPMQRGKALRAWLRASLPSGLVRGVRTARQMLAARSTDTS